MKTQISYLKKDVTVYVVWSFYSSEDPLWFSVSWTC